MVVSNISLGARYAAWFGSVGLISCFIGHLLVHYLMRTRNVTWHLIAVVALIIIASAGMTSFMMIATMQICTIAASVDIGADRPRQSVVGSNLLICFSWHWCDGWDSVGGRNFERCKHRRS